MDNHFDRYFDILFANTPDLLEQVNRVRYDVYCREFHYEQEEDCPGGMERDEYDDDALQILAVQKTTSAPAGCVRMISPPLDQPDFLLPMERHCGHTLNHPERHPRLLPREGLAEISRLAVHTSFRRRLGETDSPIGVLNPTAMSEQEQRTFPLISLALFAGATALLALTRRPHMFVMMEPRLARRLRSLGFPFVQVGEILEYHGKRAAYHVTVDECMAAWDPVMLKMYQFIHTALQERADRQGLSFA
ncbi:PEP-CTERM/exosortase system-associated acyltransferase [Thiocystis violascens]|uniref:Putative PEP-CTERM/exosortase system-associated acyltransferase n=1 Tax=Thiocystis violascens (strain ATCC 17096 / DSM 198 / 6111) TaxID=765911 RepID=I3YGG9_THIV6|nr:PEP-CTERM/exosortase system-associated acyltransferase [Thiocystis violascens]AFL76087.1 putative PEP-CTERM/exosortase system-associated acyltransferase [Thiocystis violascens DSM 198]